jgi:hypothetical protein
MQVHGFHSLTHPQTQHFTHSNNSLNKSIMPVNHYTVEQFNENIDFFKEAGPPSIIAADRLADRRK